VLGTRSNWARPQTSPAVLEDLQSLNIPFVSLKEGLDLGSASGRLQLAILAALSQFERKRLRERTVAGLQRARAQGKRLGRPPEPVPVGKLEPVKEISVREGARRLGVARSTPPALASTGPTKPLRPSLTFRLRIRTNQGHLERARWPDHSDVL
jgi:DNA invertase Pin-like site-specific DNA recombinase